MLIILGILLFGALLTLAIWFPGRDEWDWYDEPLIISVVITFLLLLFGPLFFIGPIEKSAYVGEEEYTYEIQYDEEKYCDIEEDGDIIVKLMDKNGNVSTATYYKDKTKFEEGNKASIIATYNKYDWNERKATWLGLWGMIWEPSEDPTSVIITLPTDEYNEAIVQMEAFNYDKETKKSESTETDSNDNKNNDETQETTNKSETTETSSMNCKNCNEIYEDDDKFCSNCGEKLVY